MKRISKIWTAVILILASENRVHRMKFIKQ